MVAYTYHFLQTSSNETVFFLPHKLQTSSNETVFFLPHKLQTIADNIFKVVQINFQYCALPLMFKLNQLF